MHPFAHLSRYPVRRLLVRPSRSKKTTAMLNARGRDSVGQNKQTKRAFERRPTRLVLQRSRHVLYVSVSWHDLIPYHDESERCRKQHASPVWT